MSSGSLLNLFYLFRRSTNSKSPQNPNMMKSNQSRHGRNMECDSRASLRFIRDLQSSRLYQRSSNFSSNWTTSPMRPTRVATVMRFHQLLGYLWGIPNDFQEITVKYMESKPELLNQFALHNSQRWKLLWKLVFLVARTRHYTAHHVPSHDCNQLPRQIS